MYLISQILKFELTLRLAEGSRVWQKWWSAGFEHRLNGFAHFLSWNTCQTVWSGCLYITWSREELTVDTKSLCTAQSSQSSTWLQYGDLLNYSELLIRRVLGFTYGSRKYVTGVKQLKYINVLMSLRQYFSQHVNVRIKDLAISICSFGRSHSHSHCVFAVHHLSCVHSRHS